MTDAGTLKSFEPVSRLPEDKQVLLDILIRLAMRKRLILIFTIFVTLIVALVVFLMPQTYTATSMLVPPQQVQTSAAAMLSQLNPLAAGLSKDLGLKNPSDLYVAMLRSRTIADSLINQFDLRKAYYIKTYKDTRKKLDRRTNIRATKEGVIEITVDDRDPVRAAELANAYVAELQKLTFSLAVTEASQRRLFYERQLLAAKENLSQAEVELRQTQERTGLIQLDGQARAIIGAVASLKGKIAAKAIQVERMRMFATEQNPDLQGAEQELTSLRAQLALLERREIEGKGDIQLATAKVPAAGLEYVRRLRNVKYHETIFELLAKQFEVAKLDEAKNSVIIQVLDKAVVPEKRSSPKRLISILVGTLIGFILALCLALTLDTYERRQQDAEFRSKIGVIRSYLYSSGSIQR